MFISSAFPEKYWDAGNRAKAVQNRLYWSVRNRKHEKEKIAFLYFSHGAVVKQFTKVIDRNFDHGNNAKYCSISAMSVKNKKSKPEMTMYDGHLKGDLDPSNIDFSGMTGEER